MLTNTIRTDTTAEMIEVVGHLTDERRAFNVFRCHEGNRGGSGTPWRIEIVGPSTPNQ